jgi:hypothetical protein
MISTVLEYGSQLRMNQYQIMIQVEVGENVHYWLLNLGSEPAVFASRQGEGSLSPIASSAEEAITRYLKARNIKPHKAQISYPKDLTLLAGEYKDFMRFEASKFTLVSGD